MKTSSCKVICYATFQIYFSYFIAKKQSILALLNDIIIASHKYYVSKTDNNMQRVILVSIQINSTLFLLN